MTKEEILELYGEPIDKNEIIDLDDIVFTINRLSKTTNYTQHKAQGFANQSCKYLMSECNLSDAIAYRQGTKRKKILPPKIFKDDNRTYPAGY